MEDIKKCIIHTTERIPDIVRTEVYTYGDLEYSESFDDLTGTRMFGHIKMYKGIRVCSVGPDGVISMAMPTGWVTNHKDMMALIEDIQRLDEFLAAVVENYK